jgi:predicted ATPase
LLDQFPDGVFFIDLSTVSDPKALTATAAQALGVPRPTSFGVTGQGSVEELLMDFLRTNTCLAIFDNCEHMLDEAAELVDQILSACPTVTVLATSREPLDVEGEQAWRVPSMSVADNAAEAQGSEAVSLFKARAKAVQPDFELTPANVGSVAEICSRLDGIPLAIEFAAARISHLSPQQIAERLSDRFHLLTGSRRRVQRQQTLQAALDWSYDLLREEERMLLRRLAVFAGPFRLASAEGVCSDDALPKRSVTDVLGSLVAKSLVVTEPEADELRFRLLETVRLYAEDHLVRAGESAALRRRHRDHFLAWLSTFSWDDIYIVSRLADAIESELPQLRAAVEWSAAEGEHDVVAEMAARMFPSLYWNLHVAEGNAWMSSALPHVDPPPDVLINWLTPAAAYAIIGSSNLAEGMALTSRATQLSLNERGASWVMVSGYREVLDAVIAVAGHHRDAEEGIRTQALEVIDVGRAISPAWEGMARIFAAQVELCFTAPERAMPLLETGICLIDREQCAEFWLAAQSSICAAAIVTGDTEKAVLAALEGLEHPLAGRWMMQLEMVAGVAFGLIGEHERAKMLLLNAIERSSSMTVPGWLEETLAAIAVYLVPIDPKTSSALLSWVKSQSFDKGNPSRTPVGYTLYRHGVSEVRRLLSDADVQAGKARGSRMTREEAADTAAAALHG